MPQSNSPCDACASIEISNLQCCPIEHSSCTVRGRPNRQITRCYLVGVRDPVRCSAGKTNSIFAPSLSQVANRAWVNPRDAAWIVAASARFQLTNAAHLESGIEHKIAVQRPLVCRDNGNGEGLRLEAKCLKPEPAPRDAANNAYLLPEIAEPDGPLCLLIAGWKREW